MIFARFVAQPRS